MANIPTKNNNPGDLKSPSTGQFQVYKDPQEGFNALKADLQGKITGNTRTGLNGKSTLQDFASTWAPASDKNDPIQYAKNLAKKLGVTTDTPIGKLSNRLDDFASAIADNEGYQGNRVLGSSESAPSMGGESTATKPKLSHEQLVANINAMEQQGAKPQEVQGYLDSLKSSQNLQPSQRKTFSESIGNTSSPQQNDALSVAGDVSKKVLNVTGGNDIADAVAAQKVKSDVLSGKNGQLEVDYSKLTPEAIARLKAKGVPTTLQGQREETASQVSSPSAGKVALDVARTGSSIAGLVAGGGLAQGLINKFSPLAAKEIAYNIPMEMSEFKALGRTEKLNVLGEALKKADVGDTEKIAEAIKYLKPSAGLVSSLLKKGINTATKYMLIKTLGDTVGGLVHKTLGN